MNQALITLSLLVTTLCASLMGCTKQPRSEASGPEVVSDVSIIVAHQTTVPEWLEAVGTVRAAQRTQVASQIMGNIVQLRVHEGDSVQSGEVLALIDAQQSRAAVEQAMAAETAAQKEVSFANSDFALAEATLKRYQQLYEKKAVSPQEFDEVKARYQSAEARRDMAQAGVSQAVAVLAQAQTSLSYTEIRAPFSGLVTEKKVELGTLASPGMAVFTIEDTRSFRLEATIDESDIHMVHIGQPTSVFLDGLANAWLNARVVEIVPAADPASHTFLVKVELPSNPHLRSGVFGRVRFSRGERSALLIPQSAIVERGQLQGVYVIDANNMAGLRYVTLGKTDGQEAEVLSGLQDEDRLIAAPGNRELGGKRITIHP